MKKMMFLLLSAMFVLTGCDVNTNLEEPEVVLDPTLEVSASPDSIEYGGSSKIIFDSENSNYVLCNGERYNSKDSFLVKGLTSSTTYEIVAVGEDKSVRKSLLIKVGKVQAPTVEVVASTTLVPYGSTASFSWKINGLFYSFSLEKDGVILSSSNSFGSYVTPSLYESGEYTLIISSPAGFITKQISISVGDWTTSNLGLLTHKPWNLKCSKVYDVNGKFIEEFGLTDENKENLYYFSLDGKVTGFDSHGKQVAGCDWGFVETNKIFIGDPKYPYDLVKLTKDEFIRAEHRTNNGVPVVIEDTYWRP